QTFCSGLVPGARAALRLGFKTLKIGIFTLPGEGNGPFEEPAHRVATAPRFHDVFTMPFQTYFLLSGEYGFSYDTLAARPFTPAQVSEIYRQNFELATHLLATY